MIPDSLFYFRAFLEALAYLALAHLVICAFLSLVADRKDRCPTCGGKISPTGRRVESDS